MAVVIFVSILVTAVIVMAIQAIARWLTDILIN